MASEALGVETSFLVADGYEPFEAWDRPDLSTPEPTDDPFLLIHLALPAAGGVAQPGAPVR